MSLIRIDPHPSRRQLAVFGVVWFVFFAGWGVAAVTRGWTATAVSLGIGAVAVPAVGWLVPSFMRVVYLGLAYLTFPIGWVVSFVVLAVVYYGLFAPMGLVMRCLRYDPMCRRRDANAASYWTARQPTDDVRRYFRQF